MIGRDDVAARDAHNREIHLAVRLVGFSGDAQRERQRIGLLPHDVGDREELDRVLPEFDVCDSNDLAM